MLKISGFYFLKWTYRKCIKSGSSPQLPLYLRGGAYRLKLRGFDAHNHFRDLIVLHYSIHHGVEGQA